MIKFPSNNYYHLIIRHDGKVKHLIRQNKTPERVISEALKEHYKVPLDAKKITANTIYLCSVCNDFDNLRLQNIKYASQKINNKWFCENCYKKESKK